MRRLLGWADRKWLGRTAAWRTIQGERWLTINEGGNYATFTIAFTCNWRLRFIYVSAKIFGWRRLHWMTPVV